MVCQRIYSAWKTANHAKCRPIFRNAVVTKARADSTDTPGSATLNIDHSENCGHEVSFIDQSENGWHEITFSRFFFSGTLLERGPRRIERFTFFSFCAAWSRRWGWAFASREDCLLRLANEVGGHDSTDRVEKRISFIHSAEPMFFLARPTESLERLAALAGAPDYH